MCATGASSAQEEPYTILSEFICIDNDGFFEVDDDHNANPVSESFGCFSRSLVFDRALLAVCSVVVERAGVDVTDERHILFVTLLVMLYNATFSMIAIAPLNCVSIVTNLKKNHGTTQAAP